MLVDFHPPFNNTCQLLTVTRNNYGDYMQTATTDQKCYFRVINTIRRGTHMEVDDADAMIWFPADTNVTIGTLLAKDGVFYQIERINYARGFRDEIQFLKCDLKVTKQGVS